MFHLQDKKGNRSLAMDSSYEGPLPIDRRFDQQEQRQGDGIDRPGWSYTLEEMQADIWNMSWSLDQMGW